MNPRDKMLGFVEGWAAHMARLMWAIGLLLMSPSAKQATVASEPIAPLRVALGSFTSDDNLYRSAVAGENFSAALQTQISSRSALQWVERQQLQMAAEELNLTPFGILTMAGTLQLGKWVKADLLILGRFMRSEKEGRLLRMEIVDMERADVLAEESLPISGNSAEPVRFASTDIKTATALLEKTIEKAPARLEKTRRHIVVAPLFFRNAGSSQRLDFFEEDLVSEFLKSAAESRDIRLLRFPRANEALHEQELVVAGFVQSDQNAWRKLADVYVWGSFRELESDGTPFPEVAVEATFIILDKQGHAQRLVEQNKVAQLPAFARRLAQRIFYLARKPNQDAPLESIRQIIAQQLLSRAYEMEATLKRTPLFHHSKEGELLWKQLVETLSGARFFLPAEREIEETWVINQWHLGSEAFARGEIPQPSDEFWVLLQRSDDYFRFVERFGPEVRGMIMQTFLQSFLYPSEKLVLRLDAIRDQLKFGAYFANRSPKDPANTIGGLAEQFTDRFESFGKVPIQGLPSDFSNQEITKIISQSMTQYVQIACGIFRKLKTLPPPAQQTPEQQSACYVMAGWAPMVSISFNERLDAKLRVKLIEAWWPYRVDYMASTKLNFFPMTWSPELRDVCFQDQPSEKEFLSQIRKAYATAGSPKDADILIGRPHSAGALKISE